MVVQHNMQAMNANRMLNITTGSQAKSTEKLSSGYRINRAADDAADFLFQRKSVSRSKVWIRLLPMRRMVFPQCRLQKVL